MRIPPGIPALLLALATSACVAVDPETGKAIPRGDQRYEFAQVEKNAAHLKEGMSKFQALGSPAEKDDGGDVWIYLPERAGVLVPTKALRLEFRGGLLVEHGYHPIVLGKRL